MKYFVSMDFKSATDSDLDTLAGTVLANLRVDPDYASIKTLVDGAFATAVVDYSAALKANLTGGKQATASKNKARKVLIDVMDKVAAHVNLICDGDEEKILRTGFSAVSTEKSVLGPIAKGNVVSAKRGDGPCQAELIIEPLEGANQYAIEWSLDGKAWVNGTYSSKRKVSLVTTAPKSDTLIRYRGLGTRERKGPWSDPVSLFVV